MGIGRGIYFPTTAPTCSIVRKAHTVQFVSIRNNNWGVLSQDIRAPAAAAAGTWYWAERKTLKNRRKKKQRYALRRIWLVDTVDRLLHLAFLGPMHIHVYITQVPWSSTNQNAPRRHLLFSLSSFFRLVLSLVVCVCVCVQCHHHAKRRPIAKVVMRACFSTNFFPLSDKKEKNSLRHYHHP